MKIKTTVSIAAMLVMLASTSAAEVAVAAPVPAGLGRVPHLVYANTWTIMDESAAVRDADNLAKVSSGPVSPVPPARPVPVAKKQFKHAPIVVAKKPAKSKGAVAAKGAWMKRPLPQNFSRKPQQPTPPKP